MEEASLGVSLKMLPLSPVVVVVESAPFCFRAWELMLPPAGRACFLFEYLRLWRSSLDYVGCECPMSVSCWLATSCFLFYWLRALEPPLTWPLVSLETPVDVWCWKSAESA